MRFKEIIMTGIAIFLFSGCENYTGNSEIIIPKITGKIKIEKKINSAELTNVTGNYISQEHKPDRLVTLGKGTDEKLHLKVNYGEYSGPGLTVDAVVRKKKDNLYVTSINEKKIFLIIKNNTLTIKPEKPEDPGALTWCWSWGTSLAGNYKKIEGSSGDR